MIARLVLVGILGLAYAAPWPLLVNGAARLTGDSSIYLPVVDLEMWAHHTLFLTLFLVAAALLWPTDRWLAGIVALAGVQTFIAGPHVTTIYLLLGVGALSFGRWMSETWRARAIRWLGISGVVQALMIIAQKWTGVPTVGTFGVSGIAACYVAMTGLLLPGWLLPLAAAGVALTGSRAGIIAFLIGLGVRYVPRASVAGVLALILLGTAAWAAPPSLSSRAEVWRSGARDLVASWPRAVVGFGLGRWSQRRASTVLESGSGEHGTRMFTTAHSDAVQWLYETGALGVALLLGWCARWRICLMTGPTAAALAAVAVMALAWYPLHDLRTGILAALLVGVGSPLNEGA